MNESEQKSVYTADEIRRVADRIEARGVSKEIYIMVGNSLANDEYHVSDIVAMLRQGLRDSETAARRGKHLNLILQKAFELDVDVPLGLRKVIDEVVVEEDKAVGLCVFSLKNGDHSSDVAVPATPKVVLQEIKDEAGIAKVKEIFFDIFPEERPRGDEAFDCYRESLQSEKWPDDRLIYYLVRGEDGEIVGLTGIYSCIVHTAWLGWYGVVPSKRKRGYGHAILGSTLDAMRSMGYKFARLYTDPNVNADAQPVYKSFGFVLDSVYEDGNTAIATMKLGLSNGGETPPDWEGRPYGY